MARKLTPPRPTPRAIPARPTFVPTRVPGAYIGAAGVAGGMMPSVSSPYRGAAGVVGAPRATTPPSLPFRGAAGVTGGVMPSVSSPYRGAAGVVGAPRATAQPFNPSAYRGAAGVTGVPARPNNPLTSEQYYIDQYNAQLERELGLPPGALTNSGPINAPPVVSSGPGAPGVTSGGGATAAGGGAAAFGGGMGSMLDAIRGGFTGQRSAVDEQLAAALGAQTGRRTAAGAARDEATAQLGRIVDDLVSGAGAAGQRVGDVYSGGVSQIGQLMRDYEAMASQRAAAGGRTLSAFGADASMAQPGGMNAADYLAAEAGALTGAGTVEGAYWGARPQAYQGLASDIGTQRALAYEQLMGQIANQEQQLTAEAAGRRAQLTTEEQQAILEAQMRQWELQQQLAARSGGGGGDDSSLGFLPLPLAYGGAG